MGIVPPLSLSPFAPPRTAWFEPFLSVRPNRMALVGSALALPLFLFVTLLSSQVMGNAIAPMPPVAFENMPVPYVVPQNYLASAVASVATVFSVPAIVSPFVTNVAVPVAPVVQPIVRFDPVFTSNFASAFASNTGSAWNNSFGLTANIFVASVYALGNESNTVATDELNVASAWNTWTTALAQTLYPVSP